MKKCHDFVVRVRANVGQGGGDIVYLRCMYITVAPGTRQQQVFTRTYRVLTQRQYLPVSGPSGREKAMVCTIRQVAWPDGGGGGG